MSPHQSVPAAERVTCAFRWLWEQPHRRWLLAILVLALVVRLVWAFTVQPDPRDGRIDDSRDHYVVARHLADGDGLVGLDGEPTASPPGYPALLAAGFILPGDDVAAGRAINLALGLGLVAGVYYLGSRLWDRRAGLLAALLMALFPSNVFFTSLLMKEPAYASLMVAVLSLTLAWTMRARVSGWRLLLLGSLVAFVSLVRPEGLALVPVILAAWMMTHGRRVRVLGYAALLLAGMALVYVPWTVRNAVQMNALVVTPTGGGLVLIDTHSPAGGGRAPRTFASAPSIALAVSYANVPADEREVRLNNAASRMAVTYFFHHVPRELSLAPQRLAWFFRGDRDVFMYVQDYGRSGPELSQHTVNLLGKLADVYYYSVVGLAVLGLPFWLRNSRSGHVLLWGTFAVYVLMWAFLFPGLPRYHSPLLSVFSILAAIGVVSAVDRWTERHALL